MRGASTSEPDSALYEPDGTCRACGALVQRNAQVMHPRYCSNIPATTKQPEAQPPTSSLAAPTQYDSEGSCRDCGKPVDKGARALHPRYCSARETSSLLSGGIAQKSLVVRPDGEEREMVPRNGIGTSKPPASPSATSTSSPNARLSASPVEGMTPMRAIDGGAWVLSGVLALFWIRGSTWIMVGAIAAIIYGTLILATRRGYWTGPLNYVLPVCLLGMTLFGQS